MRQLFVRMGMSIFLLALPTAHAQWAVQMSPQDFLKPHIYTHAAIDNYGPVMGSPNNPAKTYRVVCTQTNAQTISCRTVAEKLPSGGGTWFGPWYWIAPEPAPTGYKFQSASFTVPQRDPSGKPVSAPDHCYGDDNSPIQPPGSKPDNPVKPGNPDTNWVGHKNGVDHGWSVCFIQREDANGPKWLYNLQGQQGSLSVSIFPFAGTNPFNGDSNWMKIEQHRDGAVSEPAELDVVYVKAN